ncbi:MAG: prefoldin domain-containing protein [Acidimicrobiales bacterium]
MDDGQPVSYMALPVGAVVLSSSDTQFGTVEHVLQIPELDIFDGIAVKTTQGLRFVDRDQITAMTTTAVRCALTDEEAAALPAPSGTLVLHPDTVRDEGPSLTARFGRLFGREHWKELE